MSSTSKILLKIAAFLLAITLVLALFLTLINRGLTHLDSVTRSWLAYPHPQATVSNNGFYNLEGLDSQAPDNISAARYWIDAEIATPNFTPPDRFEAMRLRLLNPYAKELPSCDDACFRDLLTHPESTRLLLATYKARMALFDHILQVQDFAQPVNRHHHIFGVSGFRYVGTAFYLDRLYLARTLEELKAGNIDLAYAQWHRGTTRNGRRKTKTAL